MNERPKTSQTPLTIQELAPAALLALDTEPKAPGDRVRQAILKTTADLLSRSKDLIGPLPKGLSPDDEEVSAVIAACAAAASGVKPTPESLEIATHYLSGFTTAS